MNRIKTKAYLEVTLEQAREWYESGNEDLKKLALTAFSEEMLIPSFKEIVESEEDYGFWNTLVCPPSMTEQLSSLASLQIVIKDGSKQKVILAIFLEKVLLYLERRKLI